MGSDHDVYQDSSFGIPAIYLNDWPDRYIHTNFDTAANIDPTKLKRAAFVGAASGYFLANDFSNRADDISPVVKRGELLRRVQKLTRDQSLWPKDREDAETGYCEYEFDIDEQLWKLKHNSEPMPEGKERRCWTDHPPFDAPKEEVAEKMISYRRGPANKGPLAVFGYDYFADHAKASGVATPKLLSYEGLWGAGEEYAYEVLNLAGGKQGNSRVRIWEMVSAEYGPVPYETVVEYLKALDKIGIVEEVK